MTVQHKSSGKRGMFYVEYEDEIAAKMIYSMTSDDTLIIEHTEVDEVLRGQNIGYELVHSGVEFARHHTLRIIPVCPFAKKLLDRKPEWQDVVEKNGS
jgi:predicted GNAT family acetyltransferase